MPPIPLPAVRIHYEKAADKYLRSLTLEDHMESVEQAMQRKITLESMDLVHARRPEVQTFNELLVQYPLDEDNDKLGQVVPDNMVVIWHAPIKVSGSFNTPLQPTGPFWVLEYVSKSSERKDYEDNIQKYEQDLKVPYYLMYYPDHQEITLYKLQKGKYFSVTPDEQGRYALPELDLEIGLEGGWVRYWYQRELLPLPGELLHRLDTVQQQLDQERSARQAAEAKSEAERSARQAAEAKSEAERSARQAAEARGEAERTRRLAVEDELTRMRAELERMRSQAQE